MTITQDDFTWMFKDSAWKNKFLTGSALSLVSLVPIIGLAGMAVMYGYSMVLFRSVLRGESRVLPEWENYGELFVDGAKTILSAIFYFIPGVLIILSGYLVLFGLIVTSGVNAPTGAAGRTIGFPAGFILAQLSFFMFFGLGIVVIMIGWLCSPVAVGQYARTNSIGAGYRLREIWKIFRANVTGFVLAAAIYFAVSYGLGFVISLLMYTIVLCLCVPFLMTPITFYLTLMFAQLFGVAYRDGAIKTGILI